MIVDVAGTVLLHFVWQGTAIALVLAVLLAMTAGRHAQARYLLSCAALAAMLGVVLATGAREITARRSFVGIQTPAPSTVTGATVPSQTDPASRRELDAAAAGSTVLDDGTWTTAWLPRVRATIEPLFDAWRPWIVAAWLGGVILLSIRLGGGWWLTRRLRLDVMPAAASGDARLSSLSARLGLTRRVTMVTSLRVSAPMVLGYLKPVIVMPATAMTGLTPWQLDAILAHELAHVRRNDYLVNLAQTLVETLLFYHPAVWWVSRQVRAAREHCCDDLAVAVCGDRTAYVRALLDLEQLRAPAVAFALGATDGSLVGRARRLLRSNEPARTPRLAAGVMALAVAAMVASASYVAEPASARALDAVIPAVDGGPASPLPMMQNEPATSVVTAPDPSGPFRNRWAWAERVTRDARQTRYWIGYGVTPVATLPPFVYIDRDMQVLGNSLSLRGAMFSDAADGLRFPGRVLAIPRDDDAAVKVLFAFTIEGGAPVLSAVHVSTWSLPMDTAGRPVFWLGTAEAADSLARIDNLYSRARTTELKHDLIAAAGVHDASSAVVAWLAPRIDSRDADELRGEAVEWVARHPLPESIALLERTARGDRASHVRQEAAEAMGDLPLPAAAPVLAALARTLPDLDARLEAVEALGARQEPIALATLDELARLDANVDVQREAVESLGDIAGGAGVEQLLALARTHPDPQVRAEAVETLGDVMPADRLVAVVTQIVDADRDITVQAEAIETLAAIERTDAVDAVTAMARQHRDPAVRREAIEALADHAAATRDADRRTQIVELLSSLAERDSDVAVQREAVESLVDIPSPLAGARLRELARRHPDARVRAEAVESLGEIDGADIAGVLRDIALADPSRQVQGEAIETLGDLPGEAGIDALIALAREHPVRELRADALEALADSKSSKARDFIARILR